MVVVDDGVDVGDGVVDDADAVVVDDDHCVTQYDDGDGDDDDDGDDDGLQAYSHHDKIPPWWEYVSNDKGGNVSVSKSHHT